MDAAVLTRLLGPEGERLLAALPEYDERNALAVSTKLRAAGHDPDLVSAALTQAALRQRGEAKFGAAAAQMFFTQDGLEQATRPAIASRHADRFRRAGATTVYDLGSGIGSDAIAFAQVGLNVVAVERDPATAAIAAANLADSASAEVQVSDAEGIDLPMDAAVWLDPARRTPGVADINGRTKRTFNLEQLTPSWEFITELGASGRSVGVKLSPSFRVRDIPADASAVWTSYSGEALECSLWFGPAAGTHRRSAEIVTDESVHAIVQDDSRMSSLLPHDEPVGPYLYEADRALVQADLTAAISDAVDGAELADGLGYVSSQRHTDVRGARRYRVLDQLPFHAKVLREWARAADVGNLTIKKRGIKFDDDRLRKVLKLRGSHSATILVTQAAGEATALVLERDDQHVG